MKDADRRTALFHDKHSRSTHQLFAKKQHKLCADIFITMRAALFISAAMATPRSPLYTSHLTLTISALLLFAATPFSVVAFILLHTMSHSLTQLRSRSRQSVNTMGEAGIVMMARRLADIEDGCPTSIGSIFEVPDDVPEHFDARNPPQGIHKNSREAKLLQRLYGCTTIVKCHIERCKKTFKGFGQILHHKRAERDFVSEAKIKKGAKQKHTQPRKISKRKPRRRRSSRIHICLDATCLASFNKGFNANRHYFTQHKERARDHVRKAIVRHDTRSIASSKASDHIQHAHCNKLDAASRTPVPSQTKPTEARAVNAERAERSSHTTVTRSGGDGSAADAPCLVSSDIREGALSLMKLRYPDEHISEGRLRGSNGLRHSRYRERF